MTINTKKPLVAITSTVLLSSLVVLAIQVQITSTDNIIPEVYAGGLQALNAGDIIVSSEQVAGLDQALVHVDPSTGVANLYSGILDLPLDIRVDAAGDIIILNENGVVHFDTTTGVETEIANVEDDLMQSPSNMDLDNAGSIFVIDDDGAGNGLIIRIDAGTGSETLIASDPIITGSTDIAVESSGDILVLNVNSLYRVDPISGTPTLLTSDVLEGTETLIVTDAGDIYSAGTEVVSIDPITGVATTLSSASFNSITGIGAESDGNIIAVDVDADSVVYRVDAVSGAETVLSSDSIFVDSFASALTVVPGASTPVVTCQGVEATIVGTDGADMLTGTAGDDVIDGLDGDDVITGLDGNDIICGGGGDDFIDAGKGNDSVKGNGGKDVIIGSEGNDVLKGDGGKDTINGSSGNDIIEGGDNDDIIIGGSEDDTIDGGIDDDLCEAEVNDTTTDCETINSI